jgi:hypothetical protein
MSHRIIISSVAQAPAEGGGIIALHEAESINVTVEYVPSHDLSDNEVGKRVAKLLRQVRQMQGHDHEHEES